MTTLFTSQEAGKDKTKKELKAQVKLNKQQKQDWRRSITISKNKSKPTLNRKRTSPCYVRKSSTTASARVTTSARSDPFAQTQSMS